MRRGPTGGEEQGLRGQRNDLGSALELDLSPRSSDIDGRRSLTPPAYLRIVRVDNGRLSGCPAGVGGPAGQEPTARASEAVVRPGLTYSTRRSIVVNRLAIAQERWLASTSSSQVQRRIGWYQRRRVDELVGPDRRARVPLPFLIRARSTARSEGKMEKERLTCP